MQVENPLDRSESLLRSSLIPGLLKAVRFNVVRQDPNVRLFEIGRVFDLPLAGEVVPAEREDLGCVVAGEGADAILATRLWAVLAGALRLDRVTLEAAEIDGFHPTRAARIVAGADNGDAPLVLGAVGEVAAEVADAYEPRRPYRAVRRLPRGVDRPRPPAQRSGRRGQPVPGRATPTWLSS